MDNRIHSIIKDLLPLYNEGLLSEETTKWIEEQTSKSEELKELVSMSKRLLKKSEIKSTVDNEKMFKKINQKLSIYQIIFVAISFFLAINTSLLNESFGFILSYTILGCVTYLFYKDIKIVFLLAFIPIFIWSVGADISSYWAEETTELTFIPYLFQILISSFLFTLVHFLFSLLGSLIGWLLLKLKEKD
ncbi:hypothetical protein J9303_14280 [Bacillaceae bacterium Marseille-Q3522]|nr:hypothetical protein [Bacillaceae bacterium Marseille-Q3522]